MLAVSGAFIAGRYTSELDPLWWFHPLHQIYIDLEQDAIPAGEKDVGDQSAADLIRAIGRYTVEHNGDISGNPMQMLSECGAFDWPVDASSFEAPVSVPPRLSPDLKANRKWLLFYKKGPDLNVEWHFFADGTWSQVPLGQALQLVSESNLAMYKAGYPIDDWRRYADRTNWWLRHKAEVQWDAGARMYVVRPPPGTSQNAMPH